jgi:hypothetical protein
MYDVEIEEIAERMGIGACMVRRPRIPIRPARADIPWGRNAQASLATSAQEALGK